MSLLYSIKNIYYKAETLLYHHSLWTSACYQWPLQYFVKCVFDKVFFDFILLGSILIWSLGRWEHCTQKGHRSVDGTLFCLGSYHGQCWDPVHPFHRILKVRFREFSWIMCYLWIQGTMESPTQNVYKQGPCFSRIRVLWIRCLLEMRLQPQPSLSGLQLLGESWGEKQAAWNYLNLAPCMCYKILETEEIKEKKKNIFVFLLIEKLFLEVIT